MIFLQSSVRDKRPITGDSISRITRIITIRLVQICVLIQLSRLITYLRMLVLAGLLKVREQQKCHGMRDIIMLLRNRNEIALLMVFMLPSLGCHHNQCYDLRYSEVVPRTERISVCIEFDEDIYYGRSTFEDEVARESSLSNLDIENCFRLKDGSEYLQRRVDRYSIDVSHISGFHLRNYPFKRKGTNEMQGAMFYRDSVGAVWQVEQGRDNAAEESMASLLQDVEYPALVIVGDAWATTNSIVHGGQSCDVVVEQKLVGFGRKARMRCAEIRTDVKLLGHDQVSVALRGTTWRSVQYKVDVDVVLEGTIESRGSVDWAGTQIFRKALGRMSIHSQSHLAK